MNYRTIPVHSLYCLGEGMYGHLGLIPLLLCKVFEQPLSVRPFNPGPFNPPEKGTEARINPTIHVWKESHQTSQLIKVVKMALISQADSAYEPLGLQMASSIYSGRFVSGEGFY